MYQDQQGLPRRFYKEQSKEGEEGADKRSIGKIMSLSGQFCDTLREAENKIKWRERVAGFMALQQSP